MRRSGEEESGRVAAGSVEGGVQSVCDAEKEDRDVGTA